MRLQTAHTHGGVVEEEQASGHIMEPVHFRDRVGRAGSGEEHK
jgi:hypothetical protein